MNPQGNLSDRALLERLARRAMVANEFEPDFSALAVQELDAIDRYAPADPSLRDLEALPWCSIDNDDSLDLDQLSVAEARPDGLTRILVAVADVDALVPQGSAIDAHAALNTTSVYTPAAVFAMLPKALSTNLTSLNYNEDRAAIVISMDFAANGELVASDVTRARVRNKAKLAYRSVGAWLEGQGPMPAPLAEVPGLAENIRLQSEVAQRLLARRRERGALSLETSEARAVITDGRVSGLEAVRKNQATELIENFMVAANGAVATFLETRGFPSLRRVLREPERWNRIVLLAAGLGEKLPAEPDGAALEKFLDRQHAAAPEKFADLSLAVVKLLGRGEYVAEPPGGASPGHFGLAVGDYVHSTAPNRRFTDLVTQRLLKAALAGAPPPYPLPDLTIVAQHCTERESAATKVERQIRKSAAALLLSHRIGDEFDGIVTGVSHKGTWVRLFQPPVEGRLTRGFEGLHVGDRVRVRLVGTDIERGFVDFDRVAVRPLVDARH